MTAAVSTGNKAHLVKEFFSVCGAVFTERRYRLTAANLEKLVFLKYNMTDTFSG